MLKRILFGTAPVLALVVACSNSNGGGTSGGSCTTAGGPVAGAADTHCQGDAGPIVQPVSASSCHPDAGAATDDAATDDAASDDGGSGGDMSGGGVGAPMFNQEGDDDDCKYHVKWTATPICTGADVFFVVTVTVKGTGQPMTGSPVTPEVFLNDTHPAPSSHPTSTEGPPGTYRVGPVRFDASGQWTVRFHFNEQCEDTLPDSPHGHAAFFVNVP